MPKFYYRNILIRIISETLCAILNLKTSCRFLQFDYKPGKSIAISFHIVYNKTENNARISKD